MTFGLNAMQIPAVQMQKVQHLCFWAGIDHLIALTTKSPHYRTAMLSKSISFLLHCWAF